MERNLTAGGRSMDALAPEELERAWEAAKAQERGRPQDPRPKQAPA
jgi:hypothetical protein